MERTVKVGDKYYLEYISDSTGRRIKQIPLDEAEYKGESVRVLAGGCMKGNPGVSYSEAVLAVSKKYSDLFTMEAR